MLLLLLQASWLKDMLLNEKAHIYVCGDSQMSAGVSAAIGQTIGAPHHLQRLVTATRTAVDGSQSVSSCMYSYLCWLAS